MTAILPISRNADRHHRFLIASQKLNDLLLRLYGKESNPNNQELPYFSAMTNGAQERATHALEALVQVAEEMISIGHSPLDSGVLAWRTLQRLGFRYPSNAFESYRGEEDIIQIYDADQRLIFASLNFFLQIGYSTEDVYARPWFALWERDKEVEAKIMKQCMEILKPEAWSNLVVHSPVHEVIECGLPTKRRALTTLEAVAPIVDPEGNRGFIGINRLYGAVNPGSHKPIVIPRISL